MQKEVFELQFHGRRDRSQALQRTDLVIGIILFAIGLFGLYKSHFEMNTFYGGFLIGGILSLLSGYLGKTFIKEKCLIRIGPDEIEYKNSFRKPRKFKTSDLLDVRVEKEKVEFVMTNQRIHTFDFSALQAFDPGRTYTELQRLKESLID
jgi:hypothetical protein